MEKNMIIVTLIVLSTITALPLAWSADDPKKVAKWFRSLPSAKLKTTELHFFYHDTVSGKTPSAIAIAKSANFTDKSPTQFGKLYMMDDPLTTGPDPNSEPVGRAQGIWGSSGEYSASLLMTLNYVFTCEEYKGSTLSILARNPYLETYREMPIVGGTGVFRLARGIATAQTYYYNTTTLDAIMEYHVIVLHY